MIQIKKMNPLISKRKSSFFKLSPVSSCYVKKCGRNRLSPAPTLKLCFLFFNNLIVDSRRIENFLVTVLSIACSTCVVRVMHISAILHRPPMHNSEFRARSVNTYKSCVNIRSRRLLSYWERTLQLHLQIILLRVSYTISC